MIPKIGVVSPRPPQDSRIATLLPQGCQIFWFYEIESCFAFLLADSLDKLLIDSQLLEGSHACTKKYQDLIKQQHPSIDISLASFATKSAIENRCSNIQYFPKIDILFKQGEIKSLFQPIVEDRDGSIIIHGIECLSRFYFNDQNYAPEFVFNYATEKLKLAGYDKICLMQALSLVPSVLGQMIFVNVRPQTLISDNFCAWFKGVLKQHQLSEDQIVIEVTEQYCNIFEAEFEHKCQHLKNQGIKLAIDDFGSGISNLAMLEIMKPDYIKISGRFIRNLHSNPAKIKLVKNVLDLAFDLDVRAVVESVETKEEWQQLRDIGAKLAQGYYFSRPTEKDGILSLLKHS